MRRFLVAWTLGWLLGALVRFLAFRGRIRIQGEERLWRAAREGRTFILTNHPSLLAETFLLGAVVAPLYLRDPARVLWTMPDVQLLDLWRVPRWLRDDMHCIAVDRRSRIKSGRAAVRAKQVLLEGGSIVAHPEMGRTFGKANKDKRPLTCGDRAMQKIESSLTEIAAKADAFILPGWVDVPHARDALSLSGCFWRLFSGDVITFSFGEPYKVERPFDLARENKRLQERIFAA